MDNFDATVDIIFVKTWGHLTVLTVKTITRKRKGGGVVLIITESEN